MLRRIADGGTVSTTNRLMKVPNIERDLGLKSAGVFRLICNECDQKLFSDYENPLSYEKEPTGKMIAQIALKNALRKLSKAQFELELWKAIFSKHKIPDYITRYVNESTPHEIAEVSVQEYRKGLDNAKRVVRKGVDDAYRLFSFKKLNYVIPIAFQDSIRPYCDFEDNIINDFTKVDAKISELHICIFPLEKSSVVFMFGDSDSRTKKYRQFRKQLLRLSDEDKLAALCYLPFRYSEDVYLHQRISPSVLEDDSLSRIASMTDTCVFHPTTPRSAIISAMLEGHSLLQRQDIPNLLLPQYAIEHLA